MSALGPGRGTAGGSLWLAKVRAWTLAVLAAAALLTTGLVFWLWRSMDLSLVPEWADFTRFLLLFLTPYLGLWLVVLPLSRGRWPAVVLLAAAILIGLWGLALLGVALADESGIMKVVLPVSAVFHQWLGVAAATVAALVARWLDRRRAATGRAARSAVASPTAAQGEPE